MSLELIDRDKDKEKNESKYERKYYGSESAFEIPEPDKPKSSRPIRSYIPDSSSDGGSFRDYNGDDNGSTCFIATAVYKDDMAWQVLLLRRFRDQYLTTNPFGRSFIRFYYKVSPPIANFLKNRDLLSKITKFWLDILCLLLKKVIR